MGMKELKIASFETVKLAVQKGFDWIESDDKFYDCYGELDYTFQGYHESVSQYSRHPAPSLELLQKWLREVHKIIVEVIYDETSEDEFEWMVSIYKNRVDVTDSDHELTDMFWDSYEEALDESLYEALKLVK